jgi:chromosome segregation ATPase
MLLEEKDIELSSLKEKIEMLAKTQSGNQGDTSEFKTHIDDLMKEKEAKLKEINTLQNQMSDLKTKSKKSMELESKANEKLMETEELNFKN